jgi:hypothetical protein
MIALCGLRQCGEKVTDPDDVLDMQQEHGLSVCPSSSPLIIKSGFLGCIQQHGSNLTKIIDHMF